MSAVVEFRPSGFTDQQYQAERQRIRETYGESSGEAGALRDQALASLFYRSEWTQERLAKAEKRDRSYIARRLLFGRFLSVVPIGTFPRNLTEGRFRGYWEQTDKDGNERQRFIAVQKLMADQTVVRVPPKKELGNQIIKEFADSKWHDIATMVSHLNEPQWAVEQVLSDLAKTKNSYRIGSFEKKQRGKSVVYRLIRAEKRIDLNALMQDLGPILDGLKTEGRKNVATISPGTVAHLAHQIEQLLEKLAK